MLLAPKRIKLNQIGEVLHAEFRQRKSITCYVGANAATPTAAIKALTGAVKSRQPQLP